MLARSFVLRSLWLAAVAVCIVASAFAQEEPAVADDLPALSLQRLTVGVRSSFFYAPWKDLNDSFGAVRDAYAYNAVFGLKSGSIDRHRGDMSVNVDAMYRIVGPISLVLEGYRTFSTAKFQLRTVPTGYFLLGLPDFPAAFENSFDLSVTGIGGGFVVDLLGSLRTRVRVSAGQASATLDYAFSEINDIEVYRLNASLADQSTYIVLGLEGSIPIFGSLSLNVGVSYRSVRFAQLEGDGTIFHEYFNTPASAETVPFHAELVKAGSYYGINSSGDWRAQNGRYVLISPWVATPGTSIDELWSNATRSTLYLSGFGIQGGISYAF